MDSLPESVLINNIIIEHLLPINTMDFVGFLNYKLVNKTWYNKYIHNVFDKAVFMFLRIAGRSRAPPDAF